MGMGKGKGKKKGSSGKDGKPSTVADVANRAFANKAKASTAAA